MTLPWPGPNPPLEDNSWGEKLFDELFDKAIYALAAASDTTSKRLFFASVFGAYGLNPFMWREKSDGTLEYGFAADDYKEALPLLNQLIF
jgi:hypothetical protein